MEKETKQACALYCCCSFLVQAKRRKGKEEEKASWKRRNQGMELSHLFVRKNPKSSHVWDLFIGFNWGLMFVLILFWL